MQLTTTIRSNIVGTIKTAADAGGANTGKMRVYTGSSPGVGSAVTGTLLAELTALTLTNNSNGTMTVAATQDSSADASGTPGYCRILTSANAAVADLTAGVGSGEVNFDSAITSGGTVSLTSGTLTAGNA